MYFKLNNLTNKNGNGKILWCILGFNKSNNLDYGDKDGNLVKANFDMNTLKKMTEYVPKNVFMNKLEINFVSDNSRL